MDRTNLRAWRRIQEKRVWRKCLTYYFNQFRGHGTIPVYGGGYDYGYASWKELKREHWCQLRRQIATNLHIRVGLSANKMKAIEEVNAKAEHQTTELLLRDPHIFEFAGFKASEVVSEDQLEDALISHLQDFLLEMGKGFCFEARQKRIIIDGESYFADLVLYNRILHASTIIELKNDEFRHEHIGQMNAYVRYYAENEMHPGDNPPIGILLCTKKGKKMVEYALGGMDQQLFVSTYKLQLPDPAVLQQFITDQLNMK